jgi:molybdopterin/thiamine biosynthesis adenylyltransferase
MATVAVVGAGGLGGPIAMGLVAAGHQVVIYDDDRVELSNLQRQVAFTLADVDHAKASVLAQVLGPLARAVAERFTAATSLAGVDAIVDGSDSPTTKFAVAAWARQRGLPYVVASALRYGGNVFAASPGDACYACLFEDPPVDARGCGDAGVLGPVVGWIGGVAAAAMLDRLADRTRGATVWVLDDLRRTAPRTLPIAPRSDCGCRGER